MKETQTYQPKLSFPLTAPFVMIYLKRYLKVTILFTVTFFSDSYVLVVFHTTLLGCLDFTISVGYFNIKNLFGIHEFDSISQMSLAHHLWICYLILDAIWWYTFDTSSGNLNHQQSHILYCSWRRIFLKWLAKTFISTSNKGSFIPCFLFSQIKMHICFGLY